MSAESERSLVPKRIANYWILENLGSGYSGSIYRAQHIYTGQHVALKLQDINHECPTNKFERGFYPLLQGGVGLPTLWAAGVEGMWDYMAIDLLGASLDSLYRKSGIDVMDLRSVCCIAMQVISRLEFMHSRGVLHRDIQLGNCVIGLPPNEQTVYMIDFGFSKRYIDPRTGQHIENSRKKRDFIGNYWFSSVGVHCLGRVPSRRDDLEAAALMFIHLLTPRGLSWTRNGVPKTDDAHERLKAEKKRARPEDLCRSLPPEFEEFLRYCRRLKFADHPDYARWRNEFMELAISEGFPASDKFVWPPPTVQQPIKSNNAPRRSLAPPPDELERILNDLTNMNIGGDRPVLGDRKNIDLARQEAMKDSDGRGYIVISDSDDSDQQRNHAAATPKAQQLKKLTTRVSEATDNLALSRLVKEFSDLLYINKSKVLTKEAFLFLDALIKQLADPSVFIAPLRTSHQKEQTSPLRDKLGIAAELRIKVGYATTNKALADLVKTFGSVTNRSSGRTVTKDGFAFLNGLSDRLRALQ